MNIILFSSCNVPLAVCTAECEFDHVQDFSCSLNDGWPAVTTNPNHSVELRHQFQLDNTSKLSIKDLLSSCNSFLKYFEVSEFEGDIHSGGWQHALNFLKKLGLLALPCVTIKPEIL